MANKFRNTSLLIVACSLFFAGCGGSKGPKESKKIEMTPTEMEKAALLKQLDRKFENPQAHYELGQIYQDGGFLPFPYRPF